MLRYILLLLIAFVAGMLWRFAAGRRSSRGQESGSTKARMLKCDYCQVYVPESDTVRDDDHIYCCRPHQLLHRQETPK
ncbi:MAG: PP0621 family protein [Gammaproteobacteria bacterium]